MATNTQWVHAGHQEPAAPAASIAGVRILEKSAARVASNDNAVEWRLLDTVHFRDVQSHKGASITIGRNRRCDITIDHDTVSSMHCRIDRTSFDSYVVQDCGSSNGVYIATNGPGDVRRRVRWCRRHDLARPAPTPHRGG